MPDSRPKDIEDVLGRKFYKRVEKRKDKLVYELEEAVQYNKPLKLPLTAIHDMDDHKDINLTRLNSAKLQQIKFLSDDPPTISFDIKQGQTITCDYLCVEYFRPYLISDDRTSFQRYKYFEFYYDEYILSCLIDVPTFQKEGSFIPAEMDRREWSHAKLQMKLWNSVLAPEIEEIDIKSSDKSLSPALEERFLKYAKQHFKKSISYPYPNSNRLEWLIFTYLQLMQLLSALPKKHMPCYVINFVCRNKEEKKRLTKSLERFLNQCFAGDLNPNDKVMTFTSYQNQNPINNNLQGSATPYIFVLEGGSSAKQMLQDLSEFSQLEDKSWSRHPFRNRVPICISEKEFFDSTVCNIPLSQGEIFQFNSDLYCGIKNSVLMLVHNTLQYNEKCLSHLTQAVPFKKSKLSRSYKKVKKKLLKHIKTESPELYQPLLFPLSIFFIMFYSKDLFDVKFHKATYKWFEETAIEWKAMLAQAEEAAQYVLHMVKKELAFASSERPLNQDEFYTWDHPVFLMESTDEEVLCYQQKRLEELIQTKFPTLSCAAVIEILFTQGYLHTNPDSRQYVVKLGNTGNKSKAAKTFGFIVEKINSCSI